MIRKLYLSGSTWSWKTTFIKNIQDKTNNEYLVIDLLNTPEVLTDLLKEDELTNTWFFIDELHYFNEEADEKNKERLKQFLDKIEKSQRIYQVIITTQDIPN